MESTKLMRMSE